MTNGNFDLSTVEILLRSQLEDSKAVLDSIVKLAEIHKLNVDASLELLNEFRSFRSKVVLAAKIFTQ